MKIKVLGPGCMNCKVLHETTQQALAEAGIQADLEYIQDMNEIGKYDIFATPGLVIDGEVVHQGKPLPNREKIRSWIESRAK
jgi:small redox-active disulfide protein 2